MLLQDPVWQHAMERPGAIAIVSNGRRVTYRQLDDWSNQIARLLLSAGCRAGDRIGLLMPKSVEAIAAMLGVLKSGGIYVPIDTRSPVARVKRIIESCEPRCLLGSAAGSKLFDGLRAASDNASAPAAGWLDLEIPPPADASFAFVWSDLRSTSAAPLPAQARPGDPAHILFTSGSTGVPKGVVITHDNVTHFLNWAVPYFGIGPGDRNSGHPPLHFDLSTFDIYGTFLAGAELHLVPAEVSLLPHKTAEFIQNAQLTQWFSVPSVLKFMAQFDVVRQNGFPSLKRILWCGEALPTPILQYWMRRLPDIPFTNLYGPTEATIASSYYTVPRCPERETDPIPIGVPCGGEQLAVLDRDLRPVPTGETGDLYIAGAGLSPGYWNDPEKTAAVFVTNPSGERIYKTGDLARVGEDGLFYLLGRSDSQIKSRGYRIELGEIEAALYSLRQIRECAVVAVASEDFDGAAICCAYAAADGGDPGPARLREDLSALLPPYMIPTRWLCVEFLPLNANGKVDRPRVREQFQLEVAAA